MSDELGYPSLFGWGRVGVPGEFDSFMFSIEMTARMEAGEDVSRPTRVVFSEVAVEAIANRVLADVRRDREQFKQAKGHPPKLTNEAATWTYMLLAYCTLWRKPPPPALMWLLFETLGLREGHPAPEVARTINVIEGVDKIDAFRAASMIDGEADAADVALSLSELSRRVGVSRQTLRRWRTMQEYIAVRDVTAVSCGKMSPWADLWEEVAAAVNREFKDP